MERRNYKRFSLNANVLIYYNILPVIYCNAINIGTNGLLVDAYQMDLEPNDNVKLEFENLILKVKPRYKICARVVHKYKGLSGFSFVYPNNAEYVLPQILLNEIRLQRVAT